MPDSSETNRQIDAICNEFEEEWSTSSRPNFDSYCERMDSKHQEQLLEQLVQIDVELRVKAGHSVQVQDYRLLGQTAVAIVERELELQQTAGSFSNVQAGQSETSPSGRTADSKQIGPYKLLQQIGEGGMGSVWMAEQEKPVRRRVALKVIKDGMADRQVIARFEAERQALTMMDHRCIARVLDAGETSDGNPYFVMELVNGIPITEYCDNNKLTVRERLELMVQVCHAVQHAHQKGIIHRDLKPSNVLVTLYEGKPLPKVIDFGLAKALEHTTQLTDKTMFTEFGQVVGTLQYMSPEQAELNSHDIDTRTDVYALGIMLYELLTGTTPLNKETIGKNALLQILEIIREQEPPKPSDRLSSTKVEAATDISDRRKIAPARLQYILRGELDWVVMKALEKDRTRRYETANSFADDISRYLNDEPVEAKPPSARYKLKKFVKKNRALVASVSAIATLLIAGIFGTTWFAFSSKQAETEARKNQVKAEKSAEQTERILGLMIESFQRPDPSVDGRAVTVASILDDATLRFKTESNIDRHERIRLLQAIALSYRGLGLNAEEKEIDEFILPVILDSFGENAIETINAQSTYATTLSVSGENEEALKIATAAMEKRIQYFPEDWNNLSRDQSGLASIYFRDGKYPASIQHAQQSVDIADQHPLPFKTEVEAREALAYAMQANGDYQTACDLLSDLRQRMLDEYGDRHPTCLKNASALAIALSRNDKITDAKQLIERQLPLMDEVLGPDHRETLTAMNILAVCYSMDNQPDKGLATSENLVMRLQKKYPPDHHDLLAAEHNLAIAYQTNGQLQKAIDTYLRVIEQWNKSLAPDHPDTLRAMGNLALVYFENNQFQKAINLFKESLALKEQSDSLGPDHPETLWSRSNLATCYLESGDLKTGIEMLEQLLPLQKRILGESSPAVQQTSGKLKQAREMLEAQ